MCCGSQRRSSVTQADLEVLWAGSALVGGVCFLFWMVPFYYVITAGLASLFVGPWVIRLARAI